MRSVTPVIALLLGSLAIVACTAPAADDGADDQTSNVTGGSGDVQSATVILFDGAGATASPKCTGALLGEKVAVTAKSCAKEGMLLQRAEKDAERVKIKAVHTPEGESDIAIVELDKAIKGTTAVLTHMPLRAGYSINGIKSSGTDKGQAGAIKGAMTDETSLYGSITPDKGSEICEGDVGAPVCSTNEMKIFGRRIYGTCGLSGIVVSRADAIPQTAAKEGEQPAANGGQATTPATAGCSNQAWKVAQLGQHAAFIKKYAPNAFQPMKVLGVKVVPSGLWGYETKGTVKQCKIETATLAPVEAGKLSAKLVAKVSFADMAKRASPTGRFGIAPKADPSKVRWLPAQQVGAASGKQFDAQFEGVVGAERDGDYLVMFRASANGGESWTQCDTDGGDFSPEKSVELKVGAGAPPPGQEGETTPQDAPATPEDTGFSDPPPSDEDSSFGGEESGPSEEGDELTPKKKDSSDGGCSVSHKGGASALPILGVLLGLAAVTRRRRAR